MDNFSRKRFKRPREFLSGISEGDFSLRKREFDAKKTRRTINRLSKDGKLLKTKAEELKLAHRRLLHPDPEEKRAFIEQKRRRKKD